MTSHGTWLDDLGIICLLFCVTLTLVSSLIYYLKEQTAPFPNQLFCFLSGHTKELAMADTDADEETRNLIIRHATSSTASIQIYPDMEAMTTKEHSIPDTSESKKSSLTRSKSKKELVETINHDREVNKLKWEDFGDRIDLLVKFAAVVTLAIILIIMFSKVVFT